MASDDHDPPCSLERRDYLLASHMVVLGEEGVDGATDAKCVNRRSTVTLVPPKQVRPRLPLTDSVAGGWADDA